MPLLEIRHTLRNLAANPGFTAIAAISLALGIGANTAIFSLADALLLRPLAVADPAAVLTITTNTPDNPFGNVSYPDYRDLSEKSQSFDGMVACQLSTFGVAASPAELPHMNMGMMVSGNFFRVLGVEPALGRAFLAEEGKVPGRDAVVVLGYDYWESRFGRDTAVVGRTLRVNGIDFNIVGVAPRSFTGMDQYIRPAFYLPAMMAQRLTASPDNTLEKRIDRSFSVKGRLKAGFSPEAAQSELATIWRGLQQAYPDTNRNRNVAVHTELQTRIQRSPPDAMLIGMLMALVGLVLIIACANVANLLLARGRSRSREIAIRIAVGAGRMRLLRQFLVESLALALIGAALGLLVAYGGIRFLQTIRIPTDLPIVLSVELDQRVLLFSLLMALVSAVFFGLAPAWQTTKTELVAALRATGAGAVSRQRTFGRNVLVVGQVALSMVLLVAAGMLLDGFRKSLVVDPGFRTDHRMMMEFDTSLVRYSDNQTRDFYRNLVERARSLAGVRSVTLTQSIPFSPNQSSHTIVPEGYKFPKGQDTASVLSDTVDEHYFDTMRMEIVRGRAFTAADKADSRRVVIVNSKFAKTFWPNQDPLGKRLRLSDSKGEWLEVVGVAKTSKYLFIAEPEFSYLYVPFAQNQRSQMTLVVESHGDPASVAAPLRDVVRALDANQPMYNVRTFSSFYEQRAIAIPLMIMEMVAAMGLIGLTLALIGLYGLIAYSVARRTQEIGVRMAIGASRADVLKMVLVKGLTLALSGIAVGGVVSIAVARLLAIGMVGLGSPNPTTYIVVPIILMMVTLAACYLPARRASLVDPIRALRWE